jgi:hypothetical protein
LTESLPLVKGATTTDRASTDALFSGMLMRITVFTTIPDYIPGNQISFLEEYP